MLLTADADVLNDQIRLLVADELVRVVPLFADQNLVVLLVLQELAHEVEERGVVVDDGDPRAAWRVRHIAPLWRPSVAAHACTPVSGQAYVNASRDTPRSDARNTY